MKRACVTDKISDELLSETRSQRHIEAIREFNNLVSVPPASWTNSLFYQHDKMVQWALDAAEQQTVEKAPEISF